MNPINNSFTSIEQVTGQYLKTQDNKTKEKTTGLSFEDVLRQQMGGTAESQVFQACQYAPGTKRYRFIRRPKPALGSRSGKSQ